MDPIEDLAILGILQVVVFGVSRCFNFRPRVSKLGEVLLVKSDWKAAWLSLGFGSRRMTVNPTEKVLRLFIRRFWFFYTSRRIEFEWVQQVIYDYNQLNPASVGWGAYQETDLFKVGLLLKNGEQITLFRFFGEGDFVNNSIWPDWMYWQNELWANMTKGPQERESSMLADLLSGMIAVPLGGPMY